MGEKTAVLGVFSFLFDGSFNLTAKNIFYATLQDVKNVIKYIRVSM